MIPLDDLAILAITGEDAVDFLQGQTTCDVKAIPLGGVTIGAVCTVKGRVLAVFRLLRFGDGCLVILPKDIVAVVRRRLAPYVLRARVNIGGGEQDAAWSLTGLLGKLDATAAALGFSGVPEPGRSLRAAAGAWLIGLERGRKFLLAEPGGEAPLASRALPPQEWTERGTYEDWLAAEIADGIPIIMPVNSEEYLPQMLNLDLLGGIGFTKGCYTGQEIIARAHYLGAVKRRMHRLRVRCDDRPAAGTRIARGTDDSGAGQVVVSARTPDSPGCFDLLAVLTAEGAAQPELRLDSRFGAPLERVPLPYSIDR